MSYTPTTWTTGDTITASAMNKIENGIASAGGALICNIDAYNTLDKTVQEIYDALESGTPAYITYKYGVLPTDYASHKHFAPIIKVYGYAYSDAIRIVASWAVYNAPTTGDGGDLLYGPATVIFEADDMNAYPVFYRTVKINNSALTSFLSILG